MKFLHKIQSENQISYQKSQSDFLRSIYNEIYSFLKINKTIKKNRSIVLVGGKTSSVLFRDSSFRNLIFKHFNEFFLGDERCHKNSKYSNYSKLKEELFRFQKTKTYKFYKIFYPEKNINDLSYLYSHKIPSSVDLIILSVADDGHIASLFPNSFDAKTKTRTILVKNSPKPPKLRISISPKVIMSAKKVIVIASGYKKGLILAKAIRRPKKVQELPVRLTIGKTWILDKQSSLIFKKYRAKKDQSTKIILS